jgi:MFS family permease
LTGSSLNERWRARMFGFMTAGTGLIMLAIVPLIGFILGDAGLEFPNNYALLFATAGAIFAISILPMLFVHELPGGKAVEKIPTFGEFLPELGHLLRTDIPFRAMIVVQVLTSFYLMAMPFYIGFSTVQLGLSSKVAVPNLLAMQTIGSIGGSLVYTWLGARDNVLYIRLALIGAALLPITALFAVFVGPLPLYFGFLMSGIASSNLMFGYMNWIVAYAPTNQRPIYIGLSNTIAAVVSMIVPIIGGTIAQHLGYEALFMTSLVMALAAIVIMLRYVQNTKQNDYELGLEQGQAG